MDIKISFGIIVLNGEPFTRYNLRALYPFAHQIIVVEGATPAAAGIATPQGHSRDNTLEIVQSFQRDEDPDGKVILVTAEQEGHPDGFWPGEKDQMSHAYATRVTGDYLWQVDVDEFYQPEEMNRMVAYLQANPDVTAATFKMITFWGGIDYLADGWFLRRGEDQYHRLFKWNTGYRYAAHRPPTVVDERGVDLRKIKWLAASDTNKLGIRLYHYSLVFPKQVAEKTEYYQNVDWARRTKALQWAEESYETLQRPYRVHNIYKYPSWLERFSGEHPPEILALQRDLRQGHLAIELRSAADIEQLLKSPGYRAGRTLLKVLTPGYLLYYYVKRLISSILAISR